MLASGNRHKLHEFRQILAPHEVLPMPAGVELPPEGEVSFLENARGKARALARAMESGGDVPAVDYYIGDDSGLEVDALGSRPGVLSSRYAGDDAEDADNNAQLLAELAGRDARDRAARFVCVLAAVSGRRPAASGPGAAAPEGADRQVANAETGRAETVPDELVVRGEWRGAIAAAPRGSGGFGYDPLFLPAGGDLTVAELPQELKDRTSHRALAGAALLRELARRT